MIMFPAGYHAGASTNASTFGLEYPSQSQLLVSLSLSTMI
jgi:hypothetical protein